MLNRRSLRIKAMQTFYAFLQCKKSDYHVAMDLIEEKLTPGFEVIERPPQEVIEENKRVASTFYKRHFDKSISNDAEGTPEAKEAASDSIAFYDNLVSKDLDFFTKNMISELEKLEGIYLLLLLLPLEIIKVAQQDDTKQEQKYIKKKNTLLGKNLTNSKLIQHLFENHTLSKESERKRVNWNQHFEKINEWYRDIIKKDEEFSKYAELESPTIEDDKKVLNHFYKNIIFKLKNFETHFEEQGVRWEEDKEILKGMITKTIKTLGETENYQLELFTKSEDWDEEKDFFVGLFKNTNSRDEELDQIIKNKATNWDIERIALLDKIIIKLALTEMITFPGIPVKVTINEYLEISKRYSTPKSRQFINGLLDTISNELISKGVIKKSGRGLIDNK